jgi:ClpP class serine protease
MMMGHETVSAELRRARMDKDIAAVVFRVDSRGGEGLASDLISREVQATVAVKPVVVSMVDVAASGGYMISYRASKIVADPMTITGSIGSISASSTWPVSTTSWGSPGTIRKGRTASCTPITRTSREEQRAVSRTTTGTASTVALRRLQHRGNPGR